MSKAMNLFNEKHIVKLVACAFTLLGCALQAQAMTCSVPSGTVINFGAIDVLSGNQATATSSMAVTCTAGFFDTGNRSYLCLRVGDGAAADGVRGGAVNTYSPRLLVSGSNYAGFQLYKDPGYSSFWGTNLPNASPNQLSGGRTLNEPVTFYAKLKDLSAAINGTMSINTIPPGSYINDFSVGGGHTQWTATLLSNQSVSDQCGPSLSPASGSFNFTVQATVQAKCNISTGIPDINFGTQSSSATNLQGATALAVQCTRTTPYFIGLKPGNNNANGAGVMLSSSGQVAYQLRRAPGTGGGVWGNTATSVSVGNGVAGMGTGYVVSHPIYATVPSADAPVGNYSDTVTVTVNY